MQWRSLVTDMQIIKQTIFFVFSVPGSAKKTAAIKHAADDPPLPQHNIEMIPRAAKEHLEKTAVYFAAPRTLFVNQYYSRGLRGWECCNSYVHAAAVFFADPGTDNTKKFFA